MSLWLATRRALLAAAAMPGLLCLLGWTPAVADKVALPQEQATESVELATRFRALAEFHHQIVPDQDKTREALSSILSDPKYGGEDSSVSTGWLERFLDWFSSFFGRFGLPMSSGWIGFATALIVIGVLLLAGRLLWSFLQRRAERLVVTSTSSPDLSAEGMIALAQRAAAQGDFRTAVRLRFQALVKQLALPATSLQTNTQLIRMLKRHAPAAVLPFGEAVLCFEDAWYGGLPCDLTDYQRLTKAAEQTISLLDPDKGAGQ